MAEDSMLWTTSGTGDGPGGGYTQANWDDYHRYIFTPDVEGTQFILPRKGNKLAPTAGASSVNVDTGAAFVYGFFYKNTASVNIPITNPTLGTTGIRVVLRASWAAQTVRAAVIRNSDGVIGTPAATQTPGTTYEVTLATGTITNGGTVTLSDTRAYLQPAWEITGSMLNASIVDNSTIELVANVLRVKDAGIVAAKLASNAVTTVKILDANVTTAKIADLNVTLAKIAADSVDDTKAGDRVPQFYRRQGGSSGTWGGSAGTSNFTPGPVRMQAGMIACSTIAPGASIVFPVAFSQPPLIYCQTAGGIRSSVQVANLTTTGCDVTIYASDSLAINAGNVFWFAVGPE